MMEVKQNTTVDLNELLASSKNSGTDEVDAVMTDLTERTHDLVNCDLINTNDKPTNVAEIGNGDVAMVSLISDVEVGVDLDVSVNSDLEDALLAEDDVLPKLTSKVVEPSSATDDDLLADKVETSNSTTSSNNVRDPGDDLDTLLSKINDIVEDCIDNDCENTVKMENKQNNLNESVIFMEESNVNESNLKNKEKSLDASVETPIEKEQDISKDTENGTTNNEDQVSPDVPESETPLDIKAVDPKEDTTTEVQSEISFDETNLNVTESSTFEISNANKICTDNEIQEKTEESKLEAVQDNEITSNNTEILEVTKEPLSNDVDKTSPIKDNEAAEMTDVLKTDDDEPNTENKTKIEKEPSSEDIKASDSVENEDSDDEIVFYVDKPPELEKPKESETITTSSATTTIEEAATEKVESPSQKPVQDDDDIVLLLDDDEDDADQHKKVEEKKDISVKNQNEEKQSEGESISADLNSKSEEKTMDVDNSDNARDDFVTEKINDEKTTDKPDVAETPEETNSNCSSSSNLLQEAKSVENTTDEPTPEEAENEEDEDDNDVELIESELKETETVDDSEKVKDSEIDPPAKRLRLSEDSEVSLKAKESGEETKEAESPKKPDKKSESQENLEEEKPPTPSSLKRTHDVIELEEEEEDDSKTFKDGIKKKPKTDGSDTEMKSVDKIAEVKDDKQFEDLKTEPDESRSLKAVPSYQPIPLYPAPKFEILKSEATFSLDYLKKFRKSFDNMTKQDLEELVLQKVVEAIIHRSEFSEMRELIEKQEKLITTHRAKISELSKQFRDLEMVHNRVVKDIEQRNSQFIMPVKITRAVGLQVYIPNKKSIVDTAPSSSTATVQSSPQRPVTSQTTSSSSSLTPPQRQYLASQADAQQRSVNTQSSVSGTTSNVRRGCAQKITPIRPVPGATQPSSTGTTANSASYRNNQNHSATSQPRILNKNASTSSSATAAGMQRARYMGPNQDGQRVPTQQQQVSRTPNMAANSQRVGVNAAIQPKPSPNAAAPNVQRRSESMPLAAASSSSTSSIVDNYINTLTHLTGANTAVSITPAKPKEKAVIDLTDEDETPSQASSAQPTTQVPVTQVPRRNLPVQNNTNSQVQYGRAAPPLARIPPVNQMANNKNRQMPSMQGQKNNSSFTSISTPPGTSITRINVSPNAASVQRVKYSHPAPLPATPPQAFNPSWKLPPPRPTIRISNLDNGIVISWTMEESMDRHAECVSYQIYAYQETSGPPMVDSWRHVGDVKAMLLPMAVTLTQFQEGQRYYFAVRAVDCHQRYGPFSLPKTWS